MLVGKKKVYLLTGLLQFCAPASPASGSLQIELALCKWEMHAKNAKHNLTTCIQFVPNSFDKT